jgi:hypothetical protein
MKKFIFIATLIILTVGGCQLFSGKSEPDAIVLDKEGYHLNGTIVTGEEITVFLQEKSAKKDTSLITIELLPGHNKDQKFDLKILLKEYGIKNIKEIQ